MEAGVSSSIFSFDSLRSVKPRAPVALIVALVLVGAIDGVVRVWPDEWIVPSRSWLGEYTLIERNLRHRDAAPRVVVMGSSRGGIGLVAPALDRGLQLPLGSTINVSLQGGRPCDALRMYRRNRETLRQAKLVGRARYRTWLAYLAGVSGAFHDGSLRVYQVLASRHAAKGPSELPATRADLYR